MGAVARFGAASALLLLVACAAEGESTRPSDPAPTDTSSPIESVPLGTPEVLAAVAAHVVLDRTDPVSVRDTLGMGDEQDAHIDLEHRDARPLTAGERAAVEAALSPAQVEWIDRAHADELERRQLDSPPPQFTVLTLTVPRTSVDTVTVTASVWCGGLCGTGSTFVLSREDGAWIVTGTIGDSWVA